MVGLTLVLDSNILDMIHIFIGCHDSASEFEAKESATKMKGVPT